MNGETKAMMDHVQRRWKGACYDTSCDQEWLMDRSLGECVEGFVLCKGRDGFVWWASIVYLALKLLILMFWMLLLNCLSVLPCWLYARHQKTPTDAVERTCGFWMTYTVLMLLHIPSFALLFVSLMMDYAMYYVFGFLFTLFTWRWSEMMQSHRALDPYRGGPCLLWYTADIFTCVMGQTLRHGYLGTAYNVSAAAVYAVVLLYAAVLCMHQWC